MAAQLSVLIASVLTKPEIVQRRVSALVGAVVADAASQHLQWIYNQVKLRTSDYVSPYFLLKSWTN